VSTRDPGRFQIWLVDRRAAPIALIAGIFALLGLLFAASGALFSPGLPPQVAQPSCSVETMRCPPLDRLPTVAQLRTVRAWQLFAWELGEAQERYLMPSPVERAERLAEDDEPGELLSLLGDTQLDYAWLEWVLSERDWSRIEEGPPPPEVLPVREEARQVALAKAEAEVGMLQQVESRLRRAWDRRLSLQVQGAEADWAALTARIEHRRELARQLLPWALFSAGLALVVCLLAARKARGVTLVVTQSWLGTDRQRQPTAWLSHFVLQADETVLCGHDGTLWRLPPASPEEVLELEQALRLVLQPTPEAMEQERAQAARLGQELEHLRQLQR
jgi:hypothetical protein